MFNKGENKFIKEFDAVRFVRMTRNLKMIVSSIMNDSQRFIASYQKINTIHHDINSSSDSMSSEEGNQTR
jgi:hypothetical protein